MAFLGFFPRVHQQWNRSIVDIGRQSGRAIIFRAKAKFFRQKPAAKNEKMDIFVFIKWKHGIHSVQQDEVPEIREFY